MRVALALVEPHESEMSLSVFSRAVFWLKMARVVTGPWLTHRGFLTGYNDIPLPPTYDEVRLMEQQKPRGPDPKCVPIPRKNDWLELPFKDVYFGDPDFVNFDGNMDARLPFRRILRIDYYLQKFADDVVRLKEYFGWPRTFRI